MDLVLYVHFKIKVEDITMGDLISDGVLYSGLENREYGRGDPLRWPRDTLYPQKLALTSPTSGGSSVGIVRLRAKATEFVLCFLESYTASFAVGIKVKKIGKVFPSTGLGGP
jgi:hypothetical protein